MEVWIAKVVCLVILLSVTLVFGFSPRLLGTSGNEKYLSIANCLAGGVLMGTTLLHLLPEVVEDVEQGLKLNDIDVDYPIATLTVGLGFLLIVLVEMLAHTIQDRIAKQLMVDQIRNSGANEEELEIPDNFMEEDVNLFDSMERVRRFNRASSTTSIKSTRSGSRSDPERQALLNSTVQKRKASTANAQSYGGTSQPSPAPPAGNPRGGHGHSHDHAPPTEIKSVGSILLLFALSVHSILEGMAVGSENDWIMVFTTTGALSVHKALLAFALGVKIVEEGQTVMTHVKAVVFFAISSPVGVSIGVAIELSDVNLATKQLCEGLIQAVATGTFLYIAFVEIITPELNKTDLPPLLKVFFLAIGFGIICLVQLLPEGEEAIVPPNNSTIPANIPAMGVTVI